MNFYHTINKLLKPLILVILLGNALQSFGQDYKARINAFRKGYENDFLTDASSPLKKDDLQFLRFYDADSSYRVTADVKYLTGESIFMMPTFNGASQQYVRYALLNFRLNGKELQLTVYRSIALANVTAYKDYLFLPFTDNTNGNTTYGGGRYIDLNTADFKGATMMLDFNKAYNPYCAFSGKYSCPKPPAENYLAVAIEAGEKLFAKTVNH
ncbi:DUF1684 domain-containing protein [Mucilaginibacter gotjawali]|uniref:Uncharacterized protein n=2 Tax=Mucilaginibacter gotjawali TaxID=1550579 RepID=A0A0X8X264_9SPHI|nr:DUF1684 domain-containing protein [Mucilaginibacter gotjawali]MBB3058408.1 hypothetical protein [Mucilaginibacter gotjawali]BAU53763.1 hypothetical protein MgSA37_01934 [Mucilaginibacter gotjawali]